MPAYAFFTIVTLLFFEYVTTDNWYLLAGCVSFLTLVVLFHWTLMIPALGGILSAQLTLALRNKRRLWALVFFVTLFLGMIVLVAVLLQSQARHFSLHWWWLLYPPKAAPTGWLGFGWNKVLYAVIGVGNYLSGATNVSDYRIALGSPRALRMIGISWLYLLITLGACLWALWSRRRNSDIRLLAVYAVAVFCLGELEHLYSQPQDPQSQIQPMFVTTAGLIVLFHLILYKVKTGRSRVVLLVLAAGFLVNGFWNAKMMYAEHGRDSQQAKDVHALAEIFPPATTMMITHGFEGWQTWWFVEVFQAESALYKKRNIHLSGAFLDHAGISPQDAAALIRRRIQAAFDSGDRVVAGALWTESKEDFVGSLTSIVSNERGQAFDDGLRGAFRMGVSWDTSVERFVELLPPPGRGR
jgi:hypothetical protein